MAGRENGDCALCPEGYFKNTIGMGSCTACPDGQTSDATRVSCIDPKCEVGMGPSLVQGVTVCAACEAPQVSLVEGGRCEQCPAGSIHESASSCSKCAAGTYSAWASNVCTACERGKVALTEGSGMCVYCDPGMFSDWWFNPSSAKTQCTNCAAGYYKTLLRMDISANSVLAAK